VNFAAGGASTAEHGSRFDPADAAPPSKAATASRGRDMKMLLTVDIPHEPFNSLMRSGKVGEVIGRILETIKPEACYFSEQDGRRGAVLVVDVQAASDLPAFSEPFFLNFQADCKFRILMNVQDLQKADLPAIGKKWA
jgi:hypothetical protein